MGLFGKKKGLVGLDVGSSAVKVVELKKKGSGYEVVNLALETLPADTVVDGSIMDAPAVQKAVNSILINHKIATKSVATAVSGHSVIVKKITVAAATPEEVANAIPYEAQQYIPFDMADVNLSYQVLGPAAAGAGSDVMLVAVKREKILNYTNALSQAGLNTTVVDIDAFAVQNAFEVNYEPTADMMAALLNVGASIMNINITRGGIPLFTRDVSVGGNQYTDTLQKELDLSFEDAERLKQGEAVSGHAVEDRTPHLRSVSEILLLEVQKTFDFFRQTTSTDPIQRIYVSGGSARIEGLAELLKEEFNIPVDVMNPFEKVACNPSKIDPKIIEDFGPRMSVAVGLALRSFDAA